MLNSRIPVLSLIMHISTLYHTIPTFNDPKEEAFRKYSRKGENAGNQHFLLFPQCFLPFPKQSSISDSHLNCQLQMLSIWRGLKICVW